MTFISGNPGSTGRLDTVAHLEWLRDNQYPIHLAQLDQRRIDAVAYAARGAEQARIATDDVLGYENSLKAFSGYLSGLLDPELMAKKRREEAELRDAVRRDPKLAAAVGDPWAEIERAIAAEREIYPREKALALLTASGLPKIANTLVWLAAEREKPNAERLREYRETALPAVLRQLYSDAPLYPDYEEAETGARPPRLPASVRAGPPAGREGLRRAHRRAAGPRADRRHPPRRRRRPPGAGRRRAGRRGRLDRPADPLRPHPRAARPRAAQDRRRPRSRRSRSAPARRSPRPPSRSAARTPTPTPPSPSASPTAGSRASSRGASTIPWATTLAGTFERSAQHGGRPPYDLPPGLVAAKDRLDLATPLDFITTHDIIGGNSGSPVVDRDGRFVGIVFDINLYMLPGRFVYSQKQARSMSVHPQAILATLTKIYPDAAYLADELMTGKRRR